MKNSNDDSYSDDGVAQRLFTTPEKNRVSDWRFSANAEEYTRKLFDSNQKGGELKKNIILVMPFFDEKNEKVSSEGLLSSIFEMIEE